MCRRSVARSRRCELLLAIDAETGRNIWAERYARQLRRVLAVKDEVARRTCPCWPFICRSEIGRPPCAPEDVEASTTTAAGILRCYHAPTTANPLRRADS